MRPPVSLKAQPTHTHTHTHTHTPLLYFLPDPYRLLAYSCSYLACRKFTMNKDTEVKGDLQRGYAKGPNKNLTFLKFLKNSKYYSSFVRKHQTWT